MKTLAAIALPIFLSASALASQGGSYSGNWPVKARLPPHFGRTDCLTLVDNGSVGARHSGTVTSTGEIAPGATGTFQVVNGFLVVNLEVGSQNGEVEYISFIAPARNGEVTGKGIFNNPSYFPAEPLVFGDKGGC